MANNINEYPLAGMPPGGPPGVPTALKDTEHNADHQALSDFPGVRYIRGAECTDKNSVLARCEIWLEAANALGAGTGSREVADAGCPVRVYYNGTHKWTTVIQVVGSDCYIAITDAECDSHAIPGIADYSAGAFIAALHIFIDTYPSGPPLISAQQLLASATAPNGVNSDAIPRGAAAPAGSIEEGLADVESDAYSVIAPGGGLLADVVTPDQLDLDANVNESDENLVYGRMEEDDDEDGIVNEWLEYGAGATFSLDNTHVETGAYAQRIQAPGPGQGIYTVPTWPHLQTDFKDHSVTVKVRVWSTNANSVYVALWDGVAAVVSPASGAAGAFDTITLRQNRDAAATAFQVRIYSVAANDFWVDSVKVSLGVTSKAVSLNPWGTAYDLQKTADVKNWILNGDFGRWTNAAVGGIQYPDWWGPGLNPPAASTQDAVNHFYGTIGWQLNMNAGQSVVGEFPSALIHIGDTAYFLGYIYGVAGASPVRFELARLDTTVISVLDVLPVVGTWLPIIFPFDLIGAATAGVRVSISMPAGNNNFVLSGFSFNRGRTPIAFKPAEPIKYKWDFHWPGPAAGFPANLFLNSGQLDALIPDPCWVHKIMVYNGIAPGGVIVDTYDVMQNGVASGLATTVTGAALTGGTQVGFTAAVPPVAFAQYDRLQVQMTDGGGLTANVSCVVEAIGY